MLTLKLLIIAGPYEADRIRRAAVSAGFEAVAVEPGDSLSGWITATRPDVIVLAPQVVNADPVAALDKVRAVPRGRVPLFLVGDAEEREVLESLADGFFVRPLAPDELLVRAREILGERGQRRSDKPADDPGSGPKVPPPPGSGRRAGGREPRAAPLRPLIAGAGEAGAAASSLPPPHARAPRPRSPGAGEPSRRPVPPAPVRRTVPVTTAPAGPPVAGARGPDPARSAAPSRDDGIIIPGLAETIEAEFDAEIRDVVRAVSALRRGASVRRDAEGAAGAAELRDEGSQKTLEVTLPLGGEVDHDEAAPGASARPHTHAAETVAEVELDVPSLLARMYLSRLSGRLTLRQGQGPAAVRKYVVFERGHPVLAGSSRAEDRMGAMLIRQGRFSAAQLAACGDEGASSGRRLGAVLVDRGLIKPSELSPLVRRHYEELIYSLFSWERGAWNLGADHSASGEKVLLSRHPAALILEGIRRRYPAERSLAALGGVTRVLRLRPHHGGSELLEQMELDAEERGLVLLFDGLRRLDELRALAGTPEDRLYGLAWALVALERLDVVEAGAGEPAGAAEDIGPGVHREARDAAIDRALVMARHALVQDGDYFQVLGVSRDASTQEIRRAHQLLEAELSPEALHPTVAVALAAPLNEIREVLAEAARLMSNEDLRRQYRAALSAGDGLAADGERVP